MHMLYDSCSVTEIGSKVDKVYLQDEKHMWTASACTPEEIVEPEQLPYWLPNALCPALAQS